MKTVQYRDKRDNEIYVGILTPEGDILTDMCGIDGAELIEAHEVGERVKDIQVIECY